MSCFPLDFPVVLLSVFCHPSSRLASAASLSPSLLLLLAFLLSTFVLLVSVFVFKLNRYHAFLTFLFSTTAFYLPKESTSLSLLAQSVGRLSALVVILVAMVF